jgi:hypothetical protein
MGYANSSDTTVHSLAELARNGSIDLMVHNGDVSYADGDFGHWDIFMRKIEPIAASVPYMVVASDQTTRIPVVQGMLASQQTAVSPFHRS